MHTPFKFILMSSRFLTLGGGWGWNPTSTWANTILVPSVMTPICKAKVAIILKVKN